MLQHKDDLGRLISREQGEPLGEAVGEILYAASYIESYAGEARRISGDVIAAPMAGRQMLAVKEPVGVIAGDLAVELPRGDDPRKIAPALAAGCTVVAKPAEEHPLDRAGPGGAGQRGGRRAAGRAEPGDRLARQRGQRGGRMGWPMRACAS
ncbi:Aldehyde dehydrogenase OS=Rhodanobacter lindaniclasticus OX=75310 GN=B1991_14170 PE=3 SV=1 [Rhodanobacter lindaniclasticus]